MYDFIDERKVKILFDFEQKLKTLPEQPGVYIMYNQNDDVIYVGKAKVLKNRVRQYFKNNNHPPKVAAMVANAARFEYIIADSELEALVLENNLIKKHMPRYNILLKDDKTYPFIKVTVNEDYPKILMTRQVKRDGARYFGPYQSGIIVRDLIELIRDIFMLRFCNKTFDGDFTPQKPCLYYHLGKCSGICAGNVSKSEYSNVINDVCQFLNGKYDNVIKKLTNQMNIAAQNLDFEKASVLRDRINSVNLLSEKQKIVTANGTDIDAAAIYNDNNVACVEIFFIRNGNIVGKEHYFINDTEGMNNGAIFSQFIKQYYDNSSFLPKELMLSDEIEDEQTVKIWLGSKCLRSVNIKYPKIGKYAELIKMIKINAKKEHSEYIIKKMRASDFVNNALSQLMKLTGLKQPPLMIEAYDISNISGDSNVASMVTFKNGKPHKQGYRSFKIKTVSGQDDYGSMYEVLTRRFNRYKSSHNNNDSFAQLPDLILVDGGLSHVNTAYEAMKNAGINVPLFGIVKDDNHNTKGLVSINGEIPIDNGCDAFMLLANIQDEMHRRAITHHRNIMNKKSVESELEKIKGIGPSKRKTLVAHFKTVSKIKTATADQLASVKGIDKKTAKNIFDYFNGDNNK